LGSEAERAITAAQHEGMSMALAMDAAATACIEAVCDEVCEEIAAAAATEGLSTGNRFSPGYGDLPLTLQPAILVTLDAGRKIGLTCTDTLIMLPRKSVTAFVGLFRKECPEEERDCAACDLREKCEFKAKG
jgi:cobalamin-dependent methionine synthase I